ncbi:unannotated protein [freshwater metagenome]|uniref:Unannotated protein n=1 Tax=freshwater metagenome TaxID=449393 RepID=A0A6J5Z707_9ZZZZ|nr:VTC domain-containing protein [Actinomycetota bacterium]MSW24685.1 VTC domain-containing protein [Actinomycetota bacterium]MSX28903.1 VTC domain-containing protein [Actinomycetota bacterium]MSX43054.1 VTC domain-containing protein [Actinomycetota bacterium]MSX96720.1 VTC domain-containing protein [Actinomycetota bacterium]
MSFRIEQKLQVVQSQMPVILDWIFSNGAVPLYPRRRINSIYFDTSSLHMYHDSNEGSLPRKKVRIRCYGECNHDSGDHFLETKISSVEGRYKTVEKCRDANRTRRLGAIDLQYGDIRPVLEVSYLREYFQVKDVRLTIDTNITYRSSEPLRVGRFVVPDENIAVEVKAPNETSLDYLGNEFPFPRIRFSKYARAIEALSIQILARNG